MHLKQGEKTFLIFVIALLWVIIKGSISHDNQNIVF